MRARRALTDPKRRLAARAAYLQDFVTDRKEYFSNAEEFPVALVVDQPLDYSPAGKGAMVLALQAAVAAAPQLDGLTLTSWYSDYTAWAAANGGVPQTDEAFNAGLAGWLAGPGKRCGGGGLRLSLRAQGGAASSVRRGAATAR